MIYKKALNDLKRQVEKWEKGVDFTYSLPPIKVAIKALEKQIPKKPKVKYFLNIHGLSPYVKIKRCPSCGSAVKRYEENWMYPKTENKYCSRCGQALDWSDTE